MNRLFAVLLLVCVFSVAASATNPVAFLNTKLYPTSSPSGHGPFTLIVTGSNFVSGATVNWNGSPRVTTFVSRSELKAAITAADIAHPGTASITVANPGTQVSNIAYFTVGTRSTSVAFTRQDYSVFATPYSIVVADFNNDGKLDVAVGSSTGGLLGNSAIQVFLGNGDGTFRSPATISLNLEPDGMIAGDFMGNGNVDLITGSELGNQAFLKGNGDGTFLLSFLPGGYPPAVAADLNRDGKLDFISSGAEEGAGYAQVFLGNGDGTFTLGQQIPTSENAGGVALGDFNRDGKLDLAVMDPFLIANMMVLPGNGDGTFGTTTIYKPTNSGANIATADLTGNGDLDLVTDGLEVYLGNGAGSFTDNGGSSFNLSGLGVILADFNNDNKLDSIVSSYNGGSRIGSISALLGNGDGTFQAPQAWTSGRGGRIGVGDFNNDGRLDVVSVDTDYVTGLPTLSIFLQTTLSISPTLMNFGSVAVGTSSAPQTATLTNIGTNPLTVGSIQLTGSTEDYSQNNSCSSVLAPGTSCTINVTFTPLYKKSLIAYVRISYRGTTGSPQFIELTGTGN